MDRITKHQQHAIEARLNMLARGTRSNRQANLSVLDLGRAKKRRP
jgi:hypothetical protein